MNTYYIDFGNDHRREFGMAFMLKKDYHNRDDNALAVFTNNHDYESYLESQVRDFSKARREAMLDEGVTWFDLACAVWSGCKSEIMASAQKWLKENGYAKADEFLTVDEEKDISYCADDYMYAYWNTMKL